MCYDISYKKPTELTLEYFPELELPFPEFEEEEVVHRQAHLFLPQPVILREGDRYRIKYFEWGLIAGYMNTPEAVKKSRSWMCNARAEKLSDPKAYWYRIRHQRCLVPVSGIYEHRTVTGIRNKVPYFVRMKSREVFCLPALYNYSPIPDPETGEIKGTFTIITRSANALMKQIHNHGDNKHRMPLFLSADQELKWLEPELSTGELQELLNYELPAEELEAWPVFSIRTSKQRPDGQPANAPFAWEGLPEIDLS